ncbi:MAG TPA: hypothetical protein VKX28_06705 [Xanthobacteraceae bacterium]|nr:hypothetical protein [Xanthobacteraceae bacterium]
MPPDEALADVPTSAHPAQGPGWTPLRRQAHAQDDEALGARIRLAAIMTVLGGIAFGCAAAGWMIGGNSQLISAYFFATQDAPVLLAFGLFSIVAVAAFRNDWAIAAICPIDRRRAWWLAAVILVIACGLIWIGTYLVYRRFGLAMDEFMADFDARIIARGHLLAAVAPEWRDDVPALQPIFRLELPGNAYWSSAYLPMNAAIRAVFVLLGAPTSQGIVLAGVAIIAVFAVARRLWPDRPDAAVVVAALTACSSQFLITAMTPYAMTAHLALNMIWLWLFLGDTRGRHALAAGVGFVACGLHQVIFHPLFVAPFIVSLMRARRWKLTAWYLAAYGAIGLFWVLYWAIELRVVSVPAGPAGPSADFGIGHFIRHVVAIVDLSPGGLFFMALNLLRFIAWQSPLVIPLALIGLMTQGERNRTIVDLAAGIALTLAAMLVLMPFQGHGWGYRYLHGFLGGLALIAAQGWIRITSNRVRAPRAPAFALALSILVSLAVVLPWQAYQVRALVTPYASAVAAIERAEADVVLVDPIDIWYGEDLVRNDPFLRARPKVLSLPRLDEAHLRELCARYDVAIFDRDDARHFGLRGMQYTRDVVARDQALRALARSLRCGHPVLSAGMSPTAVNRESAQPRRRVRRPG